MAGHAGLGVYITGGGHCAHPGEPGLSLFGMWHWIPAVLSKAGDVFGDMRRGFPIGQVDAFIAVRMFDRGAYSVTPTALVLVLWER